MRKNYGLKCVLALCILLTLMILSFSPTKALAQHPGYSNYELTCEIRGETFVGTTGDNTSHGRLPSRESLEREAKLMCATQYAIQVLHEKYWGAYHANGMDVGFSTDPEEARVVNIRRIP